MSPPAAVAAPEGQTFNGIPVGPPLHTLPPPVSRPGPAVAGKMSPRARRALERAKDGAKDGMGVTHRKEAMYDEYGRIIPAHEFSTVDDEAPFAPEGADVKVHPEED